MVIWSLFFFSDDVCGCGWLMINTFRKRKNNLGVMTAEWGVSVQEKVSRWSIDDYHIDVMRKNKRIS